MDEKELLKMKENNEDLASRVWIETMKLWQALDGHLVAVELAAISIANTYYSYRERIWHIWLYVCICLCLDSLVFHRSVLQYWSIPSVDGKFSLNLKSGYAQQLFETKLPFWPMQNNCLRQNYRFVSCTSSPFVIVKLSNGSFPLYFFIFFFLLFWPMSHDRGKEVSYDPNPREIQDFFYTVTHAYIVEGNLPIFDLIVHASCMLPRRCHVEIKSW